jgi:N-acetyl-anhydromuramyl-L-alanine amidase AmpD
MTPDDPKCSLYIQAKNFTPAKRKPADVRVVVIHTAECPQTDGAAVALAKWASGPKAPQASWHYAVAPGSGPSALVQSVREECVAWAAPGANSNGLQIELCGHAGDNPASWFEGTGKSVFENGARLAGRLCKRWDIPVERLSVADLKAGKRGIIGHVDATQAFKKSTHTDQGKNFPWAEFLRLAEEEANQHE